MRNYNSKLLSILITIAVLVAMLPATAFAANKTLFDSYVGDNASSGHHPFTAGVGLRGTSMDKDGNIWFATKGGGIVRKSTDGTFTSWNKATNPALKTATIFGLALDENGGVYFTQGAYPGDNPANPNFGLGYMKDGKTVFYDTDNSPIPSNYTQAVAVDTNGIVWIGTEFGLTKFDPQKNTWETIGMEGNPKDLYHDWYFDHPEYAGKQGVVAVKESDAFPAWSVQNITADKEGGLWVGFYPIESPDDPEYGTYPIHGGFSYVKDGKITNYYLVSELEYNYKSSKSPNQHQSYKLADSWVRDITVDANGGAWITTSGTRQDRNITNHGGHLIYVSEPGAEPIQYEANDLLGSALKNGYPKKNNYTSEVRMVSFDRYGGMWIGTSYKGIIYIQNPVVSDGKIKLDVTAQFNAENNAWSGASAQLGPKYLNNSACVDIYGDTIYSGGYTEGMTSHTFDMDAIYAFPKASVTMKSAKAQKGKVKLTWSKASDSNVKSYVVYRSTKKSSGFKKIATVKGKTSYTASTKKLKKGKTYYYKVKAKTTIDGITLYSEPSQVKSAKVKK